MEAKGGLTLLNHASCCWALHLTRLLSLNESASDTNSFINWSKLAGLEHEIFGKTVN